jgi:hypothetical protein
MKRFYQQSSRFQATRAQIAYLRAIHLHQPIKTNAATIYRCHPFLEFRDGEYFVKPEIVKHFNLDAGEGQVKTRKVKAIFIDEPIEDDPPVLSEGTLAQLRARK